ncbi:hypothetical protein Sjap_025855 [Stephania japonica]|uniref:Uncharacterized protein n=1 Tax=Stephania japonica TaxID=461633 RepID=A0AAP0E2I8_9MAGN
MAANWKTISVVVVFIATLLLSSPHLEAKAAKEFDFYYYVLMWPGSFCDQYNGDGCCMPTARAPAIDFFISGLWTYNFTTDLPVTRCKNESFDIGAISFLKRDLNLFWSNIKCPSTSAAPLWKSAWNVYGVCSGLCEYSYFDLALALREYKIPLLHTLEANGILPTTYRLYKLDYIKNLIEEKLGATVTIHCNKNDLGQWQLYQVFVCVGKNATQYYYPIISCPKNSKFSNCGEEVSFPPFTLDMLKGTTPLSNNMIEMFTDGSP